MTQPKQDIRVQYSATCLLTQYWRVLSRFAMIALNEMNPNLPRVTTMLCCNCGKTLSVKRVGVDKSAKPRVQLIESSLDGRDLTQILTTFHLDHLLISVLLAQVESWNHRVLFEHI